MILRENMEYFGLGSMRKRERSHTKATPPDWFCYRWEHMRRNRLYQTVYNEWTQRQKELNERSFEKWVLCQEVYWQEEEETEHRENELLSSIRARGLPLPIDPQLDVGEAWTEAKKASLGGDPQVIVPPNVSETNPHDPGFAPVQWQRTPVPPEDYALQTDYLEEFQNLLGKLHSESADERAVELADVMAFFGLKKGDSESPNERERARRDLRTFLTYHVYFEFQVNTSLPYTTICEQFGKALKAIIDLREEVGLEQFVERPKPKWKEALQVWEEVSRLSPNRKPRFDNKFLKKLYPTKVNKLNADVGTSQLSQQEYKNAIDRLRSQTEHAYREADQRIANIFR